MTSERSPHSPDFAGLLQLVAFLRGPKGCPWDKDQTRESLKRQFLEESYEVVQGIDNGDPTGLAEELGDVLLHIAFQMRIASEQGDFTPGDVFQRLEDKLVRRHPHVFASADARSAGEVEANWEELKRRERKDSGASALDGVPKAMPALGYAQAVQVRAARLGFDWEDASGVAAKVAEEIGELEAASTPGEREAELGDLLFSLVNLCRWHKVDAEGALRKANARFYSRFTHMERAASKQDRSFKDMTMDEKEALWRQAKKSV
ncbi:MAG: nucleoside triphosphate pyrophosphohydrolase [SAR202 cluster bacterium]|nr:nucleoside triphosphate pyrophosphohydrolase [SAR202 cluster bacterium]